MKHNKLFLAVILVVSIIAIIYSFDEQSLDEPLKDTNSTDGVTEANIESSGVQDPDKYAPETGLLTGESSDLKTEQFNTERSLINQELDKLGLCPEAIDCPKKEPDDPRGASIELGQQIANLLNDYLALLNKHQVFDDDSRNLTLKYLVHPDGHVQEQAINLLSAHPVDNESGMVLINALKDGYDAPVMRQAMHELQRYQGLNAEIDALFQSGMLTGSFYVAREIAKNILPFLNADNIEGYRQLLTSLPPRSKRARYLKANIKEFDLRNTQGS